MSRKKYFMTTFPKSSIKRPLAVLSGHILEVIDRIFEILQPYVAGSCGQSPRWILHDMMQNNETLFSLGEIDINSGASTLSEGQTDQESASLLKGDSSSLCLTHQLPVENETKETSMLGNLETETAAKNDHESVELDEKGEMLIDSAEKDKMLRDSAKKDKMLFDSAEKDKMLFDSPENDKMLVDSTENDKMLSESAEKDKMLSDSAEKNKMLSDSAEKKKILIDSPENDKMLVDSTENDKMLIDSAENEKMPIDSAENDKMLFDSTENDKMLSESAEKDKMLSDSAEKEKMLSDSAEKDKMLSDSAEKDKMLSDSAENDKMLSDSAENDKMLSDSAENDKMLSDSEKNKMDIAISKDVEISPKEKKRANTDPKEDIKDLIGKNLVQIKSMSVIRKSLFIGVEIDFDLSRMSETTSPKKPEQDSSPSKKINSSKLKDSRSVASESRLTINYSDPNILDFLSKRLLSILSCRRRCMEQIHSCFKKFLKDSCDINNTILNLNFVLRHLPMKNESYFTDDLQKLRNDFINKAENMLEKVGSLVKSLENDTQVLEECLKEIDIFEKELVPFLSTKDESIPTFDDLKRFELRLKEICKKTDEIVILEDERRAVLVNSSSDFEWLVKHFVKFLIITELLKPSN